MKIELDYIRNWNTRR